MDLFKQLPRLLGFAGIALTLGYAAYARRFVRRFEDLDPETSGAPGSFLDLDGRRIHYVQAGQGAPVVLIHGWNGSSFTFGHIIPGLAQRYRVIAIDLLGYGHSARPANGDYSIAAQAELVRRSLDRLGIDRAALLGQSMGGAIAMRLALDHPECVERLILVDSATVKEMQRARSLGGVLNPLIPLAAPFVLRRAVVRRGLRALVHDPACVTPEALEGYYRPQRMKGHLRAIRKHLVDRLQDEPFDARQIGQPALILWGEHDRVVPLLAGEQLARLIPNARLIIVRGAGHLPHEEQPELCNREIRKFLETPLPATAQQPVTATLGPAG